MTVETTTSASGPYVPNGVTTTFPFDFHPASENELAVTIDGMEVAGYDVVLNVDNEGGSVIFSTAPTGAELYILSNPDFTQSIQFENAGPFLPESHDEALDRSAIRDIYLKRRMEAISSGDDALLRADLAAVGGSQLVNSIGPEVDEIARSTYINLIQTVHVNRWGVEPGASAASNKAQLQKAINAKDNATFVFSDGDYDVNDMILIPPGSIAYFEGQGAGVTRLVQNDLTKHLLKFDMAYAQGGGIHGLTLTSDVPAGDAGSVGVGLWVLNSNDNFICRDFDIVSFDKCVRVDGCFQPRFKDFRLLYFTNYGIYMAPYTGTSATDGAGSQWRDGKISNFGFNGVAPEESVGIYMELASGEFFSTIDITMVGLGVLMKPPVGSYVRFPKFQTVLADSCYYEGWTVDGTDADVFNVRMVDCWSSGSGGGAFRPVGSVRGAGLLTKGANLDDMSWIGGELRDNDCGGWENQGGTNLVVALAGISRNSRRIGSDNTYPGVKIHPGVSNWALLGNRIGNFSEGVFPVSQAEALVVDVGASTNFRVIGNDLSNPGAGKIPVINGSTSLLNVIKDNLPLLTAGTNNHRGDTMRGVSIGTVAAGSTVYMGPDGARADELDAALLVDRIGLVTQLLVQVGVAPGAGQSFTYMVRKNGVDTVMTVAINGAASFQGVVQTPFTVAPGDMLSLRLITSAGATPAQHRWSISIDP